MISTVCLGQDTGAPEHPPATAHDPEAGWSLRLPPRWREVAPEVLERINRLAESLAPGSSLRYTHAFTTDEAGLLVSPYVLVQVVEAPLRSATFEDVEFMLRSGVIQTGVDQAISQSEGAGRSASAGGVVLDRQRGVATFDLDVEQATGERTRARIWMFLAADRIIQLNGYDHAESFDRSVEDLERLAAAFRFEPGRGFRPAEAPRAGSGA
ncbi:MAG TPA: hypothetical protein PKU91_07910, partial [Phycisphaerales bacterium]|nr:hypothetical protein [Phycisphaerales bacterium]